MNGFLQTLRDDGLALLPPLDVAPIISHLETQPQYPGHVKVYPHENGSSCYDMKALLTAPGFLRYVLGYTDMIADYLEVQTPRLYSVNAFWTHPGSQPNIEGLQTMHRDGDDSNFAALFIYGTDVLTDEDGAHRFTKRDGSITTVYGSAGTVFLEDPRQEHMGLPPRTKPRLLMWARWGVSDPPRSYGWDQLQPVPREDVSGYPLDPRLQESIRLVAQ